MGRLPDNSETSIIQGFGKAGRRLVLFYFTAPLYSQTRNLEHQAGHIFF